MSVWDRGEYERTAAVLVPAAEVAVAALAPAAGERVLDVACGTGNAAALAVAAGAEVAGVDSAPRLLEVARERVPGAEFVEGDAAALPFGDGAFDAAVSVFGVIFADPDAGARELLRVVRPGGRIVVTTWVPAGPIHEVGAIIGRALGRAEQPSRWSDPAVLRSLFAGARDVEVREEEIAFTAASPEAYLEEQRLRHPMWLAAADALREAGALEQVDAESLELMRRCNEDPAAFRATSRYYVARVSV